MFISRSLTLRILIVSFLVLALPILVDSFLFFQHEYETALQEAKQQVRAAANFRAFTLTEVQPTRQLLLREIENFLNLRDPQTLAHPESLDKALAEVVKLTDPELEMTIYLIQKNKEGHYQILSSSQPEKGNPNPFTDDQLFYWPVKMGEGYFGHYIYSEKYRRYIPYLFRARVIATPPEIPTTLLVVSSNVEITFGAGLTERGTDHKMRFAGLSAEGIVLVATDPKLIGTSFDPLTPERAQEVITRNTTGLPLTTITPITLLQNPGNGFLEFVFNKEVQIGYRAYFSEYTLSVLAYVSKKTLLQNALSHFFWIYTLYGIILVIGGGFTYWGALLLSRPLHRLSFLMEEVGRGNLNVHFEPYPFGGEVNVLGKIFNETLHSLVQTMEKAEEEHVKIETTRHELSIGREVQQKLFPEKMAELPGIDLAGRYVPARDVGGDFYGYITRPSHSGEEIIYLNIADASGKGISSCLYALSARSLLRSFAILDDDPGIALSRANNAFIDYVGDTGMFVTMCSSVYHCDTKLLSYYSCGHIAPIVRRKNGTLLPLEVSGIALGLRASHPYISQSLPLYSGDIVLFYTNGLTEAVDENHHPFSLERLHRYLEKGGWATAEAVIDGLVAEIKTFTQGREQEEEMTMIVLKVL